MAEDSLVGEDLVAVLEAAGYRQQVGKRSFEKWVSGGKVWFEFYARPDGVLCNVYAQAERTSPVTWSAQRTVASGRNVSPEWIAENIPVEVPDYPTM